MTVQVAASIAESNWFFALVPLPALALCVVAHPQLSRLCFGMKLHHNTRLQVLLIWFFLLLSCSLAMAGVFLEGYYANNCPNSFVFQQEIEDLARFSYELFNSPAHQAVKYWVLFGNLLFVLRNQSRIPVGDTDSDIGVLKEEFLNHFVTVSNFSRVISQESVNRLERPVYTRYIASRELIQLYFSPKFKGPHADIWLYIEEQQALPLLPVAGRALSGKRMRAASAPNSQSHAQPHSETQMQTRTVTGAGTMEGTTTAKATAPMRNESTSMLASGLDEKSSDSRRQSAESSSETHRVQSFLVNRDRTIRAKSFPKDQVLPLHQHPKLFLGVHVNVPNNATFLARAEYGANFMTPLVTRMECVENFWNGYVFYQARDVAFVFVSAFLFWVVLLAAFCVTFVPCLRNNSVLLTLKWKSKKFRKSFHSDFLPLNVDSPMNSMEESRTTALAPEDERLLQHNTAKNSFV